MGRSNQYVFPWYARHLPQRRYENACVLGARGSDQFIAGIDAGHIEYHDITLDGWSIDDDWNPTTTYDLIVCTRCAYFVKDPAAFVRRCRMNTHRSGRVFIDWGLGDHWRKVPYLVGWRDPARSIHESVEFESPTGKHVSYLWSCFWDRQLELRPEAIAFRHDIRMCGYDDDVTLTQIIEQEVPVVLDAAIQIPLDVQLLALWPKAPQLYILTQYDGLKR